MSEGVEVSGDVDQLNSIIECCQVSVFFMPATRSQTTASIDVQLMRFLVIPYNDTSALTFSLIWVRTVVNFAEEICDVVDVFWIYCGCVCLLVVGAFPPRGKYPPSTMHTTPPPCFLMNFQFLTNHGVTAPMVWMSTEGG